MGASFRNVGQITAWLVAIAHISPECWPSCANNTPLSKPWMPGAQALELQHLSYDEGTFRFALNQDAMATENWRGHSRVLRRAGKLDQLLLAA